MKYVFRVLVFPIAAVGFLLHMIPSGFEQAFSWWVVTFGIDDQTVPGETVKAWPKPEGKE